ncbi:hypothetical protein H6F67_04545 [Microcoleus sp. FACHB-1515]|uniref:RuBisCO accumulation factor 1 n=1 Tax=Cyanophyceae TaxID=3028117 RepID=UPI00168564B3|nr:RuBisCO accumulation factor 1 [Microcoleus sp. FACHB-1515]MBD2089122.1 hypothetical protein [Microcoleus sp. FACHB-1515]
MSATPEENSTQTELLRSLRRKEGTWAEWASACAQLQKAGYSPQQIFEETGFEPIQQNQIVVAGQVYSSILNVGVADEVRSRFERTGSDTLYEFRILTETDRAAAATLVVQKGVDSEGAKEVARALKDFSWMSKPPENFTADPGDAVAYHYWKLARQQSDLQARSRLIANGLRFASSPEARSQVEKLLTDFTVTRSRPAPLLPFYRLDSEDEMPRVLPVVGKLPLSPADLEAVPLVEESGAFGFVRFEGSGAWIGIPGWQVVLAAEDPVAILADPDRLPAESSGKQEEVLVIVDRAQREWQADSYFLVDRDSQLEIQWFENEPIEPILGRILIVLRPKKILDENLAKDPWQIDE